MVDDSVSPKSKTVKERWSSLAERGKVLTKEVGSSISMATKQMTEASKQAASQAKDTMAERRKKKLMVKMAKEVDILLEEENKKETPDSNQIEGMRIKIATLEVKQREQELLIEEMSKFTNNLVEETVSTDDTITENDENNGIGFAATISQTYSLIGFAVIWALGLTIASQYAEDENVLLFDYPLSPIIWIIGAMIWSYVVLSQLSKSGSFEKLPLSFRVQSTLGVGAATSITSLLPEIQDMPPMFLIFSWLVIAATTILILSAITNGIRFSIK